MTRHYNGFRGCVCIQKLEKLLLEISSPAELTILNEVHCVIRLLAELP